MNGEQVKRAHRLHRVVVGDSDAGGSVAAAEEEREQRT